MIFVENAVCMLIKAQATGMHLMHIIHANIALHKFYLSY
jgi:hypothetical protein